MQVKASTTRNHKAILVVKNHMKDLIVETLVEMKTDKTDLDPTHISERD